MQINDGAKEFIRNELKAQERGGSPSSTANCLETWLLKTDVGVFREILVCVVRKEAYVGLAGAHGSFGGESAGFGRLARPGLKLSSF